MKLSKLIITAIILLALISLSVPHGSCLDVSCRAIKARPSITYNETAWGLGYTGKGIVIAMIDTGIDDEHESLKGKFVAGVDVRKPLTPKDGSYNPDDETHHGTYTAGIGVGSGDGEGKYKGVAPDAKFVDVCIGKLRLGYHLVKSIEWCIDHKDTQWEDQPPEYWGIDILWMMVGDSDPDDELNQAINEAVDKGIIVVGAVGNAGPDNNEAGVASAADREIGVAAVDDKDTVTRNDDEICDFSSRGPRKDDSDDNLYDELQPTISAYGAGVVSAKYDTEDEYWCPGDGTCPATAHVAGVVALMLEANPDLTPAQVKQILQETAEARGTPEHPDYPFPHNKWNRSYGYGIVDAYEAVKRALELKPPEPNKAPTITIATPQNNAKVSDTITISGTALDTDGNVTNVELKFDDNNWFNVSIVSASSLQWNYTWNTKNVENGKHTIYARSFDGENYSATTSVGVNVYNEVSAGGVGKETKINPVYLITGAGIIGAVVIIVVCLLLFRRKRLTGLPTSAPPPPATGVPSPVTVPPLPVTGVPSPVTVPPPPVTGVPSITAQCPTCGNIIQITSAKRPLKVKCPKCGAGSILR
ncbi:MAG: S8 family serine peptidase [Thermoplasmatales archaeon]|nr:S8 family serine peptidase [Thermoplasmatales archaeon]